MCKIWGMDGFKCINCGKWVSTQALGTEHRNHCPFCLWSVHLDRKIGDRQAACGGKLEPIGLAFKTEGGRKLGELCVVHRCLTCGVVRKNRLAGDDDPEVAIELFKLSLTKSSTFDVLAAEDADEIITQLFGRPNLNSYKEKFGF